MFKLIAGPCVIENEEMVLDLAQELKNITDELGIELIFKASFDKANRTSINSFRGLGIDEGLRILQKVKDTYGLKTTTDIHEPNQAQKVANVVDILQIPAFLCRQTDLLVEAAKTGKEVNVKKAQFLAPWDMENVVRKLEESGCEKIYLTERGTTFGYNRLVVDFPSILEMKKFGYPIVFDATHSVQKPGGQGDTTGGNREYVEYLAKAAITMGADIVFMEVHREPDKALSDGPNSIALKDLKTILEKLVNVYNAVN